MMQVNLNPSFHLHVSTVVLFTALFHFEKRSPLMAIKEGKLPLILLAFCSTTVVSNIIVGHYYI